MTKAEYEGVPSTFEILGIGYSLVIEYVEILGIGYSLVLEYFEIFGIKYSLAIEYFERLGIRYSLVLEYFESLGIRYTLVFEYFERNRVSPKEHFYSSTRTSVLRVMISSAHTLHAGSPPSIRKRYIASNDR